MFDLRIPKYLLEFIDINRSSYCRAKYILNCVKYIKQNNINIHEYYENINYERIEIHDKEREDFD